MRRRPGLAVVEPPFYRPAVVSVSFSCAGGEPAQELILTLDGGFWHGVVGNEGEHNRVFTWPMLGLGLYVSIR